MGLGSWAEWFGAIATTVGLIFIWFQIRDAKRTARNQFLLNLDEALRNHKPIYDRLLKGEIDVKDPIIKAELWSYAGFFERINSLINDGILDIAQVDRLYGYRIEMIITHRDVFSPLFVGEKDRWQDFIRLAKRLAFYKRATATEAELERLKLFLDNVDNLEVSPHKSELDWRFGGHNIIYYDQPEFIFVVRKNPNANQSNPKQTQ